MILLESIFSNDYTPFDNDESEMTLILGARCIDGVVLIGDRRVTQTLSSGPRYVYEDKITGEIDGILTGFAGDQGAFEVFRTKLRVYVTTKIREDEKNVGHALDQLKLKISEIQYDFYSKYQQRPYRVLMGASSKYFASQKSSLYLYETDGRCFPQNETLPVAIGSGSSHILYFLKRYWNPNKTTMNEFAQLGDFLIRYVSDDKITLDNGVGLSSNRPYPQIIFIPDDPGFCTQYNNEKPKLDCTPSDEHLNRYKAYSEQKIKSFHGQDF